MDQNEQAYIANEARKAQKKEELLSIVWENRHVIGLDKEQIEQLQALKLDR